MCDWHLEKEGILGRQNTKPKPESPGIIFMSLVSSVNEKRPSLMYVEIMPIQMSEML